MAEVHNRAPKAQPRPDPNEELVKVFDSEQESEAMVVKGLLESAGIESDMRALDAPQDTFPGVGGTIILVRQEDAGQARRLIDEFRQEPQEESGNLSDESGTTEEPPEKP
jgi:Putative prokaryotic signal transducing protein